MEQNVVGLPSGFGYWTLQGINKNFTNAKIGECIIDSNPFSSRQSILEDGDQQLPAETSFQMSPTKTPKIKRLT